MIHFSFRMNVFVSLVASTFVSASHAQSFTLVDSDFNRAMMTLESIDADSIQGSTRGTKFKRPLAEVVLLQREQNATRAPTQTLQLRLKDGQRFAGQAVGFENDAIAWFSPILGRRVVPLANIESIVRGSDVPDDPVVSRTQDELLLANGDRVVGILTSVDDKQATCQNSDGQVVSVEWANVRAIRLAAAGNANTRSGSWRIALLDGSVFDVDSVAAKQNVLQFNILDTSGTASIESVQSIEHLRGRARLLTRVEPSEHEYAPYFPRVGTQQTIEAPTEVTVKTGRSRSFITVRPYSKLTWTLDGSAAEFRTQFRMPESATLANADLRIWLDGKQVWEQKGVTSATPVDEVRLPLGSAASLTLEVDFGENFDIQDQLFWIEPALLMK